MSDDAQTRLMRQPRSLLFLVACVALPWLLTLLAYLVDVLLYVGSLGHVGSRSPWRRRSALSRRLDRYACAVYDILGIPRTTLRLPRTLRNGVTRAKKLVRPFLHIETELESESDANEDGVLTPTSLRLVSKAQHKRAMLNATIRDCLRHLPAESLQSVFRVQTCTWNVGQTAPPPFSRGFLEWLLGGELTARLASYQAGSGETKEAEQSVQVSRDGAASTAPEASPALQSLLRDFPDMIVVTLQEVDMGGVALVRESTNSSIVWAEAITTALHRAAHGRLQYRKLKMIQLVGLVLLVLVQARHVNYIAHVRLSLTRTGAMRMLGNKGSVCMRATVYGKRFLFVAAHFVAHKHNERRRTRNYHAALRDIRFDMPFGTDDESDVLCTFVDANAATSNASASFVKGRSAWDRLTTLLSLTRRLSGEVERRALDQHDYVFFLGDLNSRLHSIAGAEIHRRVGERAYDYLLCHDELRQGMVSGAIFDGFQEAAIDFAPTYKFDPGTDRYDTSRKRRDPAWCDRVLFRLLQPPMEWVVAMMRERNEAALHAVREPVVVVSTTATSTTASARTAEQWKRQQEERDGTEDKVVHHHHHHHQHHPHNADHHNNNDDNKAASSSRETRSGALGVVAAADDTIVADHESHPVSAASPPPPPPRKMSKTPWVELRSIAPADLSHDNNNNDEEDKEAVEEELASSIYSTSSSSSSSTSSDDSSTSSGKSKSSVSGHMSREHTKSSMNSSSSNNNAVAHDGPVTAQSADTVRVRAAAQQARHGKRSRTEAAVTATHHTNTQTSSSSSSSPSYSATQPQASQGGSQSVPTSSTSSPMRRGLSEGTFHAVRQPWRESELVPRFPTVLNAAEVLTYYSVDALRQSDHRPVAAQFEVKVIRLDASVVNEVQNCVRARLQSDEEPTAAVLSEEARPRGTRLLEALVA